MAEPARLTFHPDWGVEQDGVIRRGQRLEIVYSPARLTACRAGGKWAVTAHYFFAPFPELWFTAEWAGKDEQPSGYFPPKSFAVPPTATELTVWFVNTDAAGGVAYDSAFGVNYRFPVESPEA